MDEIPAWTPGHVYAPGDSIKGPNPLTWWDRVRMWFGFKRKSKPTAMYVCEASWTSKPEDC